MIISLCGFMGAGKSTIGKNLARHIGYRFIDLDTYLQDKFGSIVSDIFTKIGESGFRKEELKALKEILKEEESNSSNNYGLVLALGGGTLTTEECSIIIKEKTECIYLNCPKDILVKRLIKHSSKRPLIAGKSEEELDVFISSLINIREPVYKDCSICTLNITHEDSIPQIIEQIIKQLSL